MARVDPCPVANRPKPDGTIQGGVCEIQMADGTKSEVFCMPVESVYALERWIGAWDRWSDDVTTCPGVQEGQSGVAEQLGKLGGK